MKKQQVFDFCCELNERLNGLDMFETQNPVLCYQRIQSVRNDVVKFMMQHFGDINDQTNKFVKEHQKNKKSNI